MNTTVRSRRRPASVAALGVALVVAGWLATGPASAAPQPLVLRLAGGAISVGTSELPFPAEGGFVGTWDDQTGEVAGTIVLPTVTTSVTDPAAADIVVDFTTPGDVIGTIDPTTGAAALTVALRMDIDVTLSGTTDPVAPVECAVEPIEVGLTGTFDLDTGALEVSAAGTSDGCDLVEAGIEGFLAGDTTVTLSFQRVEQATSTTSTSTTTEAPAPAPAPAAQPVQRPARFTG